MARIKEKTRKKIVAMSTVVQAVVVTACFVIICLCITLIIKTKKYDFLFQGSGTQYYQYVTLAVAPICILFSALEAIWASVSALSFKSALYSAIHQYRITLYLKTGVDGIQLNEKCCGVDNYTDWFTVKWSNKPSTFEIKDHGTRGPNKDRWVVTGDVPFSCCNQYLPRPCIHYKVEESQRANRYNPIQEMTIWKVGCYSKLNLMFGTIPKCICLLCVFVCLVKLLTCWMEYILKKAITLLSMEKKGIFDEVEVRIDYHRKLQRIWRRYQPVTKVVVAAKVAAYRLRVRRQSCSSTYSDSSSD